MPGMTGLDLQQELRRRRQEIPVIFITAQKDEAIREQALKEGAVNFLYKPFSDTALLAALNAIFPPTEWSPTFSKLGIYYEPRARVQS